MSALDLLKQHIGQQGDRKYLISSKWWQNWRDYVNFNNYSFKNDSSNSLSLPDNSDKIINTNDSQQYPRPGPILNNDLLLNNQSINLRPNLIENFDYVAVPSAIWKHLYSWYSADWQISRNLVKDSLIIDDDYDIENDYSNKNENKLSLDLYPKGFQNSNDNNY